MWFRLVQFFQGHFARISFAKFSSEFLVIIFFTILPTIVVSAWMSNNGKGINYYELYKGGEFLLYGVSFLSSASVAMTNRQFAGDDWRSALKNILIIPIVFLSITYAIVFIAKDKSDKDFLATVSYSGMAVSFVVFFFAQFWNSQTRVDVGDERRTEQKTIIDQVS